MPLLFCPAVSCILTLSPTIMESDKFKNLFNWLPSSQNNQSLPNGDREKSDNFFSKITANFEKPTPKKLPPERIFPDFKANGYEVLEKLGHNYGGGRFTYLGANCTTKQPVVIKQFQFAKPGADWSAYKAHEREIKILRELSHPGIPRYLDSFETDEGFCLVHEYKNAKSLAVSRRRLTPEKIKKIATSLLEILVYLQNRFPPVIHRDIKPENILVDEYLKVYLVDFGLARIAGDDLMQSSVISGTPGFMPPEQLLDRDLTEASDLYGLGVTLICLLTQTKSTEINQIIDSHYRLQFQELVPFLSEPLIDWLAKMVEPNASDRFPHAAAALEALTPISVNRTLPEVKLSQSNLELTGEYGEILSQTIEITNSVANTTLEGRWEITTTPNADDGLPKSAQWLKIKPTKFKRNQVQCEIAIDTENLLIDQVYERNLLLHTNSETSTQIVTVKVKVSAPKMTLAKTSAIIQEKLSSRLPLTLFLLGIATPITLVSPYIAGGISIPLVILIANDISAKLEDNDLNNIAEFSQKWLVAPSLTGIGIFLLTHLEIDWVESSTSQLLLRLLISLLMGGVGFGVFTLFKPAFKRLAVVLPLIIFASSFVFVGVTGGLLGKIAEAGVSTYILTGSVKQNLAQEKLSKRLIFQKYALRAILGVGLGTAVTWLLVYFGIGSLIL
jgi:serine/threonine protein kinase